MLDVLAWIVSVGQLPTDPGALYKEWQQRVQLFETTQCSELLKRAQRHPWLTLSRGSFLLFFYRRSSSIFLQPFDLCCYIFS